MIAARGIGQPLLALRLGLGQVALHQPSSTCSSDVMTLFGRAGLANCGLAGADGKMGTLRKGTNSAPANPMCMNSAAMAWMIAMMDHVAPPAGTVGLMYMLAGSSDPNNTDPYAEP